MPWRKRLRAEISWSYPLHCLDEPNDQPTMKHMLEENVQSASANVFSATRPTLRIASAIVDIRKCTAPYHPIIPHTYRPISHISLLPKFLQRLIYPINNGTFYLRSFFLAIALHVLYFDVTHYPPHNLWVYMFYLTHWGHCINIWYLFCSWVCCLGCTRYSQGEPEKETSSPFYGHAKKLPRLIRHTWSMYATAAPLSLAITLLYWTAIAPIAYGPETFGYISISEHGGISLLVLLDGLCIGSVPLRAKQFIYLLSVCIAYLLWSIANFLFELGNGDWPDYDDDALYPVLKWGMDSRRLSATLSASVIVVICPVLYWAVWMSSLASLGDRHLRNNDDAAAGDAEKGPSDMKRCCCLRCYCICSDKQIVFEGKNRPLLQVEPDTSAYYQEMETMNNETSCFPAGRLA